MEDLLQPVDTGRIQIIAVIGSILLIGIIIALIRRRRFKTKYAILWLLASTVILVLAVWRSLLERFSRFIGIDYPPATLFIAAFGFALLLFLHFSIVMSSQSERTTSLVQRIGLLEKELRELKEKKPS